MVSLQAAMAAMALSVAGQTVLLDFYADWCGPCRAMNPAVAALAAKGYPIKKINIDHHPQLKQKYGVTGIPCFVMVVDGREVDRVVGGTSIGRLEQMCKAGVGSRRAASAAGRLAQAAPAKSPPAVAAAEGIAASWTPKKSPSVAAVGPPGGAKGQPTNNFPVCGRDSPIFPVGKSEQSPSYSSAAANGQFSTPKWTPQQRPDPTPGQDLIAASVRLRIEDPAGHSCGSGTIIDARQGEALILTCGHIFRDWRGSGRIDVDLFGGGAPERVAGRLICCDLERDVALVAVAAPGAVRIARVAPPQYTVGQGSAVVSVGCNNGGWPSARRSRVASLNRYLGPPNIQVDDQPVEGRSGGGLFSSDGLVIGVCNAADPADREGFFAALASIHAILNKAGLAYVYRQQRHGPAQPVPRGALVAVNPPPMPSQMPRPSRSTATATPRLSTEEQAALEEIGRRLQQGAEVICVVRPHADPQAQSEIIVLGRVSADFHRQWQHGAEMVCIIRSRTDARAQSEIIVLERVSSGFIEQLASAAGGGRSRRLISMNVPRQ